MLTGVALLLLIPVPGRAGVSARPYNLRVDGLAGGRHVVNFTPTFCWDFDGNQTNWQVQVDDDPLFRPGNQASTPSVWFWDSGEQPKGADGALRCVTMRQVVKPGSSTASLDRRPHAISWRVRVRKDHGPWGEWVSSDLRMNQIPLMPRDVRVTEDPSTSAWGAAAGTREISGRTLHVSPAGDDAGPGSSAMPFRTLSFAARQLSAGDTLLVHGGIYNENVVISAPEGFASGEPGRPITVRAADGEEPVIRAVSMGNRTALQIGPGPQLTDWVIDGLTVGGAPAGRGIVVTGASTVTLSNCRWDKSLPSDATAVTLTGGSADVRIQGCLFDASSRVQIDIREAGDVEIRGNEFLNFNGAHAIRKRGSLAGRVLIENNYFHDGAPSGGVIALAAGSSGARILYNIFASIGDRPSGHAVFVYRSGGVTVENNVFHEVSGSAVQLNEMSQFGTYRNNIFAGCGRGIDFRGGTVPGTAATGAVVDFNIFHGNREDIRMESGDAALLEHSPTGNCMGGRASAAACDPRFLGAGQHDFRLAPGSPAVDAGDPLSPVPVGGGARVDIGAMELGAGSTPSDFEPMLSVADPTPRFSWTLVDVDNQLDDGGAGDFQARFQLQIDARPTFDSGGAGRAMFDSGVISSSLEEYSLPEEDALAPGDYYVRVRQWDNHEAVPGAWSDHNIRFRVLSRSP